MKLSVIIPVFNEVQNIEEIVRRVRAVDVDKEILVVDDGSTDGTREVVDGLEGVRVFHHQTNRGKGAAVRTAIPSCQSELTIIQDADLEYSPEEYPALIERIDRNGDSVVYGSRISGNNGMSYLRYYLGGRLLTVVTNLLYGSSLTDEPTCYKLFRTELLQSIDLQGDGFEFCPEVTAKILKLGIAIVETPISYHPRKITEGKKIRWTDGVKAIWTLAKYRF